MQTAYTSQVNAQNPLQGMPQISRPSSFNWKTAIVASQIALAIFVIANLPTTDATPAGYAACCALCEVTFGAITGATSGGILLPLATGTCLKGCLPIFFAPTP